MPVGDVRMAWAFGSQAWRRRLAALRAFRFDDGAGRPVATPAAELAGRVLAGVATLFIAVVGLWEIGGPFGAGHYSASTAVALAGENMLRWHVVAPVATVTAGPPTPADFYCHHPFGMFWTAAGFVALFGHHFWVCRLPAVVMSTLMPRLIFGAGRALYGPLGGGSAALGYVVLPITLAYANFFALEVPCMFGMALVTYGFVRFAQTARRRFAVIAVFGLVYSACADWPGVAFDALVLGGLFLRGFVLKRFFPPLAFERFATTWATAVVLVAAVLLFHLAAFHKLDHLFELLKQGEFRSNGSDLPLAEVLESRSYWISLAFTPLAIVVGKVGALALVTRLVWLRRDLELFPLAILVTATAQYVFFKQGADIHFFWPQYFALYFAYALGALVAALGSAGQWAVAGRWGKSRFANVSWVAAGLALATIAAIVPDGLVALRYARKSGGRFNEKGLIIHPDFDKAAALAAVAEGLPRDAIVGLPASMKPSYWMDWVLERPVRYVSIPRARSFNVTTFVLDSRFESRGAVESVTRDFAVRAFGPFLVADVRGTPAPVEGFALVRRQPTFWERLFVASTHDAFDVVADPFTTWELRAHVGQTPNPPPTGRARDFESLRILHNVALDQGDAAGAERLRNELMTGVDRSVGRRYSLGVELLGVRLERGASTLLTVYFTTSAQLPTDVEYKITSHVEAPPAYSLVPMDKLPWDVGMPFAMPTQLWRPGFIYASVTELVRRPGRERYDGTFRGTMAPVLASDADTDRPLLVLE